MVAQYTLAGATGGIVVGTNHGGEAVMGFFTKYGDSGYDIAPLAHLTKRQVRALASALGAPDSTAQKQATADLEDLAPLKPEEEAFGCNYDEIDDFLEGKEIDQDAFEKIVTAYTRTMHKRRMPAEPPR
jgi:NAD+ synthase